LCHSWWKRRNTPLVERKSDRQGVCFSASFFCGCWAKRFGTVGVPCPCFFCLFCRSVDTDRHGAEGKVSVGCFPLFYLFSALFQFRSTEQTIRRSYRRRRLFFVSCFCVVPGGDDATCRWSTGKAIDKASASLLPFLWVLGKEVQNRRRPCPCFFCLFRRRVDTD